MDLLQYSFTLDPAHRMDTIRERVAAKRPLLDGLPGLRWKAWLLSEPLPRRRQVKSYAPLYLFEDTAATLDFLKGEVYRGVTDAFGWTVPRHGPAIGSVAASIATARSCVLRTVALPDHAALRAAATLPPLPPGALAEARQLDVSHLLLRCYTFRTATPDEVQDADADIVYEVVDVSAPTASR